MHHVAINVTNIEKAIEFFTQTLDLRLLFSPQEASGEAFENATKIKGAKIKFAMLAVDSGSTLFELIQYVFPADSASHLKIYDPGAPHVAFRVDNIDDAIAKLRKKGINFNSEPVRILEGPLAERSFVYFPGPDGVLLELFEEKK